MSESYLAEIRLVSFNFPPKGWAFCDGQILPISQNQALFAIMGTTYGGDGRVTFALPDLRGKVPMHVGAGFQLGQTGGEENHTLNLQEMPAHNHFVSASASVATLTTGSNAYAAASSANPYAVSPTTTFAPNTLSTAGGSQPHANMPPYLTVAFVVSLQGIFPSRN